MLTLMIGIKMAINGDARLMLLISGITDEFASLR